MEDPGFVEPIFYNLITVMGRINTWFEELLNSTGMFGIVIGIIVFCIFFRLILFPLFGSVWMPSAGSDRVTETTSIRGQLQSDGSVYYDPGDAVITRTFVHRSKK